MNTTTGYEWLGWLMAVYVIMIVLSLIVGIVLYVLVAIFAQRVFRERGVQDSWAAWIPYFREWRLFELTGINPLLVLTFLLPVVGSVFLIIAYYRLATDHGRSGVAGAILGALFGFPVYLMVAGKPFDAQGHYQRGWKGPFVGAIQAPKPVEFFIL